MATFVLHRRKGLQRRGSLNILTQGWRKGSNADNLLFFPFVCFFSTAWQPNTTKNRSWKEIRSHRHPIAHQMSLMCVFSQSEPVPAPPTEQRAGSGAPRRSRDPELTWQLGSWTRSRHRGSRLERRSRSSSPDSTCVPGKVWILYGLDGVSPTAPQDFHHGFDQTAVAQLLCVVVLFVALVSISAQILRTTRVSCLWSKH